MAGYFLFFEAPSTIQTALALHQAIWRKDDPRWHVCGIPDALYTDNGRDFTSQHLEQVAADLKMRLVFSTPGMPRGRGRIERFFATISDMLLCDLPGFKCPANKSDRKVLLTLAQLDELLREFFLGAPHSAKAPSVRKKELLFCHVFWRNDAVVEVFGGRQNRRHIGALKPV